MHRVVLIATVVLMIAGALAVDRGGRVPRPVPDAGARPSIGAPSGAPSRRHAEVARDGARTGRLDERAADRAPVAPPAITGHLVGVEVPASGDAWVVDAIRLTATRSAVTERRRMYVTPGTGGFHLGAVAAGTWQLVVVAPVFAWGPRIECRRPEAVTVRIEPNPTGSLIVHPPRPGHAQLLAVRGPDLRGAAVHLQVFVAAHRFVDGEPWQIAGLPAGDYEVVLARDEVGPLVRAQVTVEAGPSTLDMR